MSVEQFGEGVHSWAGCDWGSLMMVKLSREAVSPYSETRSSSAEQTHRLLGPFAVRRVGFLQGSLSDH